MNFGSDRHIWNIDICEKCGLHRRTYYLMLSGGFIRGKKVYQYLIAGKWIFSSDFDFKCKGDEKE